MEKLKIARWIAWAVFVATLVGFLGALPQGTPRVVSLFAWLGSIVAIIVIRLRLRKLAGPPPKTERGVAFVAIVAAIWAGLDAFFVGQGAIALIMIAVSVLYLLPRAIMARTDRALFRLRLAKAGITLGAAAAAIAAIGYAISQTEGRARVVISAVETYKAKRGRYPERLEELVPTFLPAVPRAKPYGMLSDFRYWSAPPEGNHTLMYVVYPPYARQLYHFEEHRWSALD